MGLEWFVLGGGILVTLVVKRRSEVRSGVIYDFLPSLTSSTDLSLSFRG